METITIKLREEHLYPQLETVDPKILIVYK